MDKKTEQKVKKLLKKYLLLGAKLNKKGGPEKDGVLFEKCISFEDEILNYFQLTPTQENQSIIQSMHNAKDKSGAINILFQLLFTKSTKEEKHLSPLEYFYIGIMNQENSDECSA